jgi:hypothetical protein
MQSQSYTCNYTSARTVTRFQLLEWSEKPGKGLKNHDYALRTMEQCFCFSEGHQRRLAIDRWHLVAHHVCNRKAHPLARWRKELALLDSRSRAQRGGREDWWGDEHKLGCNCDVRLTDSQPYTPSVELHATPGFSHLKRNYHQPNLERHSTFDSQFNAHNAQFTIMACQKAHGGQPNQGCTAPGPQPPPSMRRPASPRACCMGPGRSQPSACHPAHTRRCHTQ